MKIKICEEGRGCYRSEQLSLKKKLFIVFSFQTDIKFFFVITAGADANDSSVFILLPETEILICKFWIDLREREGDHM